MGVLVGGRVGPAWGIGTGLGRAVSGLGLGDRSHRTNGLDRTGRMGMVAMEKTGRSAVGWASYWMVDLVDLGRVDGADRMGMDPAFHTIYLGGTRIGLGVGVRGPGNGLLGNLDGRERKTKREIRMA